jgi:hypothetical protein
MARIIESTEDHGLHQMTAIHWRPRTRGGVVCKAAAEIAEAEALVDAATVEQPFDEVESRSPEVKVRTQVVEMVFGHDPRAIAMADWHQWKSQVTPLPDITEDKAVSMADLVAQSTWLKSIPLPAPVQPITVSGGGWSAGNSTSGLTNVFINSSGKVNWGNVGNVTDIVRRYMGILPPGLVLQQMVHYRAWLERENADPKLIKKVAATIGKLAMDFRHYYEDEEGMY